MIHEDLNVILEKLEHVHLEVHELREGMPKKLDNMHHEMKYVGAELTRRTEVLFKKIDEHENRIRGVEIEVGQLRRDKLTDRLRVLEDWRVKVVAIAAVVLFAADVGLRVWSAVR